MVSSDLLMAQSFIIKFVDEKQRRIVIDKSIVEVENIKKNDHIKITVEKIV